MILDLFEKAAGTTRHSSAVTNVRRTVRSSGRTYVNLLVADSQQCTITPAAHKRPPSRIRQCSPWLPQPGQALEALLVLPQTERNEKPSPINLACVSPRSQNIHSRSPQPATSQPAHALRSCFYLLNGSTCYPSNKTYSPPIRKDPDA